MKHKLWSIVFIIGVLGIIGFFLGACSDPDSGKSEKPFYIAGNIPLTGPIASFSGQYSKGFIMGIDDACAQLGIDRKGFKTDFQDNAGQPTTAVTVMQKQLMSDVPDVYVSGTSGMSDAIIPEISRKDIPHFLVSFDAFMTRDNPLTFRILPNFKIEAPLFLKFIRGKDAKRVFFFTPNLKAYLEQSDKLILPELKQKGIDYKRELFEFNQKDYRPIAAKANQYNPDVIVISGYSFHLYPIIRALREYDLINKSAVICTLDYIDLLHGDTPKDELKNIAFTSPECEIPGKVQEFARWREKFRQSYGSLPSYVDAYAYDTARIIVDAHSKAGKVDFEGIRSVMPFDGIVGRIDLDDERDLSSTLLIGYLNEEGVVEEWRAK
jgi:branched-chain amino acid transport system substrate-binding protein